MVSTRKKRQSNRRLHSQVGCFDQNFVIGKASNNWQQSVVVNDGAIDQDFTVSSDSGSNLTANENRVIVQVLEGCFHEWVEKEMDNIVDTVDDRIRNPISTAIENFNIPRIELAVTSLNESSGRGATSDTANSARGEYI